MDFPAGCVVKAQTLAGGRGLRGGIALCTDVIAASAAAAHLMGSHIGDELVEQVYVEELVPVERELYAAVTIDREAGAPRVLLGAAGGVEVERAAEGVAGITLDPDGDLHGYHVRELARRARIDPGEVVGLEGVLGALVRAFMHEEAELIEVNPLALASGGRLVALDARVVLDGNAVARHPGRPEGCTLGTPFERRCAQLGAVGVELEGDVVAIISGAGLMMATLDLIVVSGGSARATVDLGGLVLREADGLAELVQAVAELRPRAVLVNAFFQLATCDALARGLAAGLERAPIQAPLVVRLQGRGYEEARALLDPFGVRYEPDLGAACRAVVAAAAEAR